VLVSKPPTPRSAFVFLCLSLSLSLSGVYYSVSLLLRQKNWNSNPNYRPDGVVLNTFFYLNIILVCGVLYFLSNIGYKVNRNIVACIPNRKPSSLRMNIDVF